MATNPSSVSDTTTDAVDSKANGPTLKAGTEVVQAGATESPAVGRGGDESNVLPVKGSDDLENTGIVGGDPKPKDGQAEGGAGAGGGGGGGGGEGAMRGNDLTSYGGQPGSSAKEPARKVEVAASTAHSSSSSSAMAVAGSGMHEDASSPKGVARNSKKRPREESVDHPTGTAGRLEKGKHTSHAEESPSPTAASPRGAGQGGVRESAAAYGGAAGNGDGPRKREREESKAPPKPLEDPSVHEVVSQDLATQEIRRVRRKENDPPLMSSSSIAAQAAAQGGERNGAGGGQEMGESGRVGAVAVVPNGSIRPSGQEENGRGGAAQPLRGRVGTEGGLAQRSGPPTGRSKPGGGETAPRATGDSGGVAGGGSGTGESAEGRRVSSADATGAAAPAGDEGRPNGAIDSGSTEPTPSEAGGRRARAAPSAVRAAGSSTTEQLVDAAATILVPSSQEARGDDEKEEEKEPPTDRSVGEEKGDSGQPDAALPPTRRENQEGGSGDKKEPEEGQDEASTKAKRRPCPDHALPVARTFFDYDSVSAFEMRMLPEFFTGRSASKTAEVYMQSRNYMIRLYQRMLKASTDGQAYLTGTECRRKLAGDVCSILRIHDFLDRFGLVNTHTGGKRPPSYPVPPPSTHLWNPTPPSDPVPRAPKSVGGDAKRKGEGGGRVAARGPAAEGGLGGGGWSRGVGGAAQQPSGYSGSRDREWHRHELVRLMESAVANPDRWEIVAQQVGGGRTAAACLKRFLNLAVEETLGEGPEEKPSTPPKPAPPSQSLSSTAGASPAAVPPPGAGPSSAGAGSTASAGAEIGDGGTAVSTNNSSRPEKSAIPPPPPPAGSAGTAAKGSCGDGDGADVGVSAVLDQALAADGAKYRRAYPDQASPSLMLASALVSNVHPEVVAAAMSAASAAAADVAGRSAAARLGGVEGQHRVDGVEMRDVVDPAAGEAVGAVAGAAVTAGGLGSKEECLGATSNCRKGGASQASSSLSSEGGRGGSGVGVEMVGAARAAVLSLAGLQARGLAELEDRRTEALVADLLEARVQRLEAKLHCFDELDQVLETERQSLEHDRAELLLDQARSMLSK